MNDDDAGLPSPRHRKPGRARTRASTTRGRHLHLVSGLVGSPGPGAYPVADLASMSAGAIDLLVQRARLEAEAGSEPLMHMVITRDVETETVTESGPFATGLEALTVASRFVEQNRAVHPTWRFTLTVEPRPGPA